MTIANSGSMFADLESRTAGCVIPTFCQRDSSWSENKSEPRRFGWEERTSRHDIGRLQTTF